MVTKSVQVERRELVLCRGAARLRRGFLNPMQSYGEITRDTIPKNEGAWGQRVQRFKEFKGSKVQKFKIQNTRSPIQSFLPATCERLVVWVWR